LIDPQPQAVEIFNSGTESADISNWIIDDSGGTTFYTIPQNNLIFPNQCLVFSADFNLNKSSADTIKLINSSQQLIDYFSYKSSSGSGISYFRLPDGTDTWTTGAANLGQSNSSREQACLFSTPSPTLTLTPTLTIASTLGTEDPSPTEQPPISYNNIYISETMVNPVSGEKEWLEIYNDNDFPVSLDNWFVDDLENSGSSPKIFSMAIDSRSYGVFNLTASMFNNDGDSVRLLDSNKNLKDSFEYSKNEQGKSLGRISLEADDFCLQEPTKNYSNSPCLNPTPTTISSAKTEPTKLSPTIIKPTPTNKLVLQTEKLPTPMEIKKSGQVLGVSNETVTNFPNNKSLINLLTILSLSYSLLTITSILFRMKLNYGKIQKLYSSPLRSS
jgi:hypothetical protein